MTNKEILTRALKSLFENYKGTDSEFISLFSKDFIMWANGKLSNFDELVAHFDELQKTVPNRKIEFIDIVSEGDCVFDEHTVTITLESGGIKIVDVLAKWTIKDGQITRCSELTRPRD